MENLLPTSLSSGVTHHKSQWTWKVPVITNHRFVSRLSLCLDTGLYGFAWWYHWCDQPCYLFIYCIYLFWLMLVQTPEETSAWYLFAVVTAGQQWLGWSSLHFSDLLCLLLSIHPSLQTCFKWTIFVFIRLHPKHIYTHFAKSHGEYIIICNWFAHYCDVFRF